MSNKVPENIEQEPIVNFCNWVSYKGVRCTAKLKNETFCKKHNSFKKDYVFVNDEMIDSQDLNCKTTRTVLLQPRSREQILQIMDKLHYEHTDTVDIYDKNRVLSELADISFEDFIETLCDKKQFFYEPKRGQNKTKDLRIKFEDKCNSKPYIMVREDCYCKECYITIAKKIGYPTFTTLLLK